MAIKLFSHIYRNRHGVLYFRAVVPVDLRQFFRQREIHRSLRTPSRREAFPRAMIMACRMKAIFETVRIMPKTKEEQEKEDKDEELRLYMLEAIDYSDLGLGRHEFDYDPNKPEDLAVVEKRRRELHQMASARSPAVPSANPQASMRLSELFGLFCKDRRATKKWKDPDTAERYDYGPCVNEFIEVVGDKSISTLIPADARKYRDAVLNKQPESMGNKDKRLNRVRAFLNWARLQHYTEKDYSGILKLDIPGTLNQSYEPFSSDDLVRLFESPPYREGRFAKGYQYWIPLIGLYTGGRLNELAQLHVNDIKRVEGVDAIDINDDGEKTTKNVASIRTVPIHPELKKAGLLEFVDMIRKEGHERLFPELRKSARAKDSFGKEPSRFFMKYRRELGVVSDGEKKDAATGKWTGRGRKVFHSLRTTANSMLRQKGVPQERRERLVGHESDAINNTTYRPADRNEMFPIQMLYDDLCNLDYGLEHAPYSPRESHRIARQKR